MCEKGGDQIVGVRGKRGRRLSRAELHGNRRGRGGGHKEPSPEEAKKKGMGAGMRIGATLKQ